MDEENGNVDLISYLPPNVIEMILTKAGMENAIKTSLLSKEWRYRWSTIPDLVFNDNCVSIGSERHFIQFVNFCLLLHQGPFDKFFLRTSLLKDTLAIDPWISRNNVKELSIQFGSEDWFRAPSCLFSCSKLTHLELYRCDLYSPPPSFQGFLFLKVLSLQLFVMPPDDIQKLISSCPLLENLTLRTCMVETELTLSAPYLKYLTLKGKYEDIYLENTPLLVEVNVSEYIPKGAAEMFGNRGCNFDRFFGGTSRLEGLVGLIDFTKYLSKDLERSIMSKQYDHLKSIELEVCFEDMNQVRVLLRLLVDSPNLKKLNILHVQRNTSMITYQHQPSSTDLAPDVDFCSKEYVFNQLKTVKCKYMIGGINEM